MKKVLIFLVALLALCSCSRNAAENEYEVIAVLHNRTNKWVVVDTLDIIYTEREALNYAGCRVFLKNLSTFLKNFVFILDIMIM